MIKYVISEKYHCWIHWEFDTFEDALCELHRKIDLPWDNEENRCPCTSWKTCSMYYEVCKYNWSHLLSSEDIVEISSKWVDWFYKNYEIIYEQLDIASDDMYQASFWRYILDVWYEHERFVIRVIKDINWEEPVEEYKIDEKKDIEHYIDIFKNKLISGAYDNEK